MPPPMVTGPVIMVDAEIRWVVAHPGCSLMRTGTNDASQTFQLTGPRAEALRREALRGERAAVQMLKITGYVAASADLTTVCGTSRPFVVTEAR